MARLIDVDELKEWILNWFEKNRCWHPYSKANNIPIPELYDILERMPTIEAEPIRHGRWIFNPKDAIEMMFTLPKCSECGAESPNGGNYCSNCGAKMNEVGDAEKTN